MAVPYRITIRLSEEDMQKMESLLDKYNFESISDIIRMAIRQFMEKYDDEGINKKVEVQLTRKKGIDIPKSGLLVTLRLARMHRLRQLMSSLEL